MNADHRTYRVPKRVVKRVQAAVLSGASGADLTAVRMAETLMSGKPVDIGVPRAVVAFFTPDWRSHPMKASAAGLYGGPTGLEWARKCAGPPAPLVAAGDTEEDDYADLAGYGNDDLEALLNYRKRATVDRWPTDAEEQALFEELFAELSGVVPGAEVIGIEEPEPEPEPPPGMLTLGIDEDGEVDENDGVDMRQLTVAAMRDAVAAASASLAAEGITAEGAAPAGDAAGPKVPPRDPRAPLW